MSNTSQSPEMVSLLEWHDYLKISSLFSHLTWTLKALVIVDSDVHSFLLCEHQTNKYEKTYLPEVQMLLVVFDVRILDKQ